MTNRKLIYVVKDQTPLVLSLWGKPAFHISVSNCMPTQRITD